MILGGPSAAEEKLCEKSEDLKYRLAEQYTEHMVWRGWMGAGVSAELWINPQTRTWTMLQTMNGVSCWMDSGKIFGWFFNTDSGE